MWSYLVSNPNFVVQLIEQTVGSIALTAYFQRTTLRSLKIRNR
jgi:hypothetical protein